MYISRKKNYLDKIRKQFILTGFGIDIAVDNPSFDTVNACY